MNTRLLIVALALMLPDALYAEDQPAQKTQQAHESQEAQQPQEPQEAQEAQTQEPQQAEQATTSPPAAAPESPAEADLRRIRAQLDRILSDAGLPVGGEREKTAKQIDALAQRSSMISRQTQSPRAKLEASNLEARGYNALAQDAYRHQQPEQAMARNSQLRAAAEQTKSIPEPAAEAVGDFWLLQADLLDLNSSETDAAERQNRAIAMLEKFVAARQEAGDAVEHDYAARQIATDVRLSLLRLYDDRGDSAKACAAVTQLRAQANATDDAALREQLDKWFGYCDVLGQRFEASLPLASGEGLWNSRDAVGQPVLLHIWASWWPASQASFDGLIEAQQRLTERGVQLVSIDLGPTPPPAKLQLSKTRSVHPPSRVPATPPIPAEATWPLCTQPADAGNLQELFHIRSLPRYVLLDADGRVIAVGGSLSILEQMPAEHDG